jgi:predicted alpha/beta hydrolase family esterase
VAARWSAVALAFQLLLAAGLAWALAASSALSGGTIAAAAVAELCAFALLLAAAPLVLGCSKAPGSFPSGRMRDLLRAWGGDALAFQVMLGRMALEPWRAPPGSAGATTSLRQRPVLLVHGFGCSRAVWRPLIARLGAAGIGPVRAVSLEPPFADVETYASELLGEIAALGSGAGGRAVTVVAHSMGALVARAALRAAAPGLIGRIVTIAAPHHGTALACHFHWANARQMRPGSRWLAELNAAQEGKLGIPVATVYSLHDNYVIPAASARLEGARAIELRGLGHLSLLSSKRALEQVLSELLQ